MTARLLKGDATVSETAMDFTGEVSTYAAKIAAPEAGDYTLEVLAADPGNANIGRYARELTVR